MARIWTGFTHDYIETAIGTLAGVGSGAYTLVALMKPNGTAFGAAGSLLHSGVIARQIIFDTGKWYGAGDFSGFGTVVSGDWQLIGQSKAAGSNVYRWHYWDYTTGGAITHADGTGTHADPGAADDVRLGDGDNKGKQTIAALAAWKRVLSDAEFESICTTALADWLALSPDALWPLNQASASDPVSDATGNGADQVAVVGTIGTDTDPPGFNYTLTPPPVVIANATSTATSAAGRTSTSTTAAGRTSTATIAGSRTSTSTVSDG